jgi:hypothetical protein
MWPARARIMIALLVLGLAPGALGTQSFDVYYLGTVNSFANQELFQEQAATTSTGLGSWDNATLSSAATDSVAIYCLVLNTDVVLDATTHTTLANTTTGETLATYYQVTGDGDAVTTTGFASSGDGVDSFLYVGGGSNDYETAEGLTAGTFLSGAGKTISLTNSDGGIVLTFTVRGHNGQDFGSASDYTEAPDSGTYTADLTFRAVSQ